MNKYILIKTDGYSIITTEFETLVEAQDKMISEYNEMKSPNLMEPWSGMSYCNEYEATLYDCDMEVLIWKIITVTP